jgi:hypothetical protein
MEQVKVRENVMDDRAELLMVSGVTATCADCGDERIFVPTDEVSAGEFCCTGCDAAVFLVGFLPAPAVRRSRVA